MKAIEDGEKPLDVDVSSFNRDLRGYRHKRHVLEASQQTNLRSQGFNTPRAFKEKRTSMKGAEQ
ncbi:hypothetical protein KEJ49_02660 [Candidatus Bathyarchaeota archaeon]|nr:hypothetical protein [Candidatus Bathyarchaeota archaeon]